MSSKDKPNLAEVEELAVHHADGGLSIHMKQEWIMLEEQLKFLTGTLTPHGHLQLFTCGLTMP
jgi:hypothetical protein